MNFQRKHILNANVLPTMMHGWQKCAFMSRRAAQYIAIKSLVKATREERPAP